MPSKHFLHQSILFTVPLSLNAPRWHLLGASGKFCLPYLRRQHELGHPVDLRAQINSLEVLTGAFYMWEGANYVEFHDHETWLTHPTRIEWSGIIRPASPEDVSRYLLSKQDDIGPIERPILPSTNP